MTNEDLKQMTDEIQKIVTKYGAENQCGFIIHCINQWSGSRSIGCEIHIEKKLFPEFNTTAD